MGLLFKTDIGLAKRFFAVLLSAIMLMTIAACSRAAPEQAEEEPYTLTMGVIYSMSQLRGLVNAYNAQSEKYKIEIVEYDGLGGTDRLLADITAGNAPDLYAFFSSHDFNSVEDPVIYEDLLPYFETDEDYDSEVLVKGLFNALTQTGSLYQLPLEFTITTFRGKESEFGGKSGMTMEEVNSVVASLGGDRCVFEKWRPKNNLFAFMSDFFIDEYVDVKAATCYFDDPGFLEILEICNQQPVYKNDSETNEQYVFDESHALSLELIQSMDRLVGLSKYTSDYCFVGCPNNSGSNGASFDVGLRFSMSNTSEHKDGAWDFMRFALSDKAQDYANFFPSVQAGLDAQLAEYLKAGVIRDADVQKFQSLLDETTRVSIKGRVYGIIMDEADGYFSGQNTASEAALLIQSRVGLYLAEQA